MIKVYTNYDSYIIQGDDIRQVYNALIENGGIWYHNDNLFVPSYQITRIEKLKPKVQDVKK